MTSTDISTGDFVALDRHGLSYRAEVVGVGPVNVRVRYTTKNGKTKTVSENKKHVSKIDDAPVVRPEPVVPDDGGLEVELRVYLRLNNSEETLEAGHAQEWLTEMLAASARCAADEGDLASYLEDYGVKVEVSS